MSDDTADKPQDIIARAKRDLAEQVFARMQQDDEQDDRDGLPLSDSSATGTPSSVVDSQGDWDLSGPPNSSSGESLGGTIAEGVPKRDTTLRLSPDALRDDDDENTVSQDDGSQAPRYRPQRRPAMAILVAWDDGGVDGERIRLRTSTFDVGRVEGELVIAHDPQMSRRHFRIERHSDAADPATDAWQWHLRDLDSLNGVFLQRRSAIVKDGDEMLLAGEVIRVKQPAGGGLVLTKVGVGDGTERVTLEPGAHLLGGDASVCTPFPADAPLLAPRHLQLRCDASHRWTVTALPGTDGVWTRTATFPLAHGDEWQAGEQRFSFLLV